MRPSGFPRGWLAHARSAGGRDPLPAGAARSGETAWAPLAQSMQSPGQPPAAAPPVAGRQSDRRAGGCLAPPTATFCLRLRCGDHEEGSVAESTRAPGPRMRAFELWLAPPIPTRRVRSCLRSSPRLFSIRVSDSPSYGRVITVAWYTLDAPGWLWHRNVQIAHLRHMR